MAGMFGIPNVSLMGQHTQNSQLGGRVGSVLGGLTGLGPLGSVLGNVLGSFFTGFANQQQGNNQLNANLNNPALQFAINAPDEGVSPADASAAPVGPGVSSSGIPGAVDNSPQGPNTSGGESAGPDAGVSGPTGPGSSSDGTPGGADNSGDAGGGAGGGGGDGGSVICTEIRRRGWMSDELWRADEAFASRVDADVIRGYHKFGKPIARAMRRSDTVARIVSVPALAWAREMARKSGAPVKGSRLGAAIMAVGLPICARLGK
jgi:hypothetical protein